MPEATLPSFDSRPPGHAPADEGPFPRRSPRDGSALRDIQPTPIPAIRGLVAKAREAQRPWAARPVHERVRLLAPVASRILDRAEALAREVTREIGRPEEEVLLGEVLATADVVAWWSERIEKLLAPEEVELDGFAYPGKEGETRRDPRGVVGLISPWNMPLALPMRTLVPALLAGNAVVWKPSEVSARIAEAVAALFAGLLPEGLLVVVQGGGDAGAAVASADVDVVCFTGSVTTGRKVAHACAERLVPCSLELGGKDAAIVLADADLDRAANGIAWAAMMNAGQNCAAVERVYVEDKVAEAFTQKLVAAVAALRPNVDVGPLATAMQRNVVLGHVSHARAGGARVLCGGQPGDGDVAYPPTVVAVDTDDTPLMRDETFGPVVPVAVVASVDEAVARANASRYGLTASVWTRKVKRGLAVGERLRAGVVTVNNHAFTGALPGAPWSGVGDSGYGVTNSPFALDALTRPRFVLVDRSRSKRELWWYPYTPALRTIALAMATLRSRTPNLFRKMSAAVRLAFAMLRRFKT